MARRRARRPARAPVEPTGEIERAAQLFRDFREIEPGRVTRIDVRLPRAAMLVGEVHAVKYSTDHEGRASHYEHKFRPGSRPLLLVSDDGRQIILYGGNYRFTADGIVDKGRRAR